MFTKMQIINLALNHLGMAPLTALSDTENPSVKTMLTIYDPCRDDLFGEAIWDFATVKEALVSVSDTVLELEWYYAYLRPVNAARVWAVYNEATISSKYEQEFETVFQPSNDRRIMGSDLESAYAEYTYIVEDTNMYSMKFAIALSYKLAAMAAPALLRDSKNSELLVNMSEMFIAQAKVLSSKEKRKIQDVSSGYRDAR